MRTVPTIAGLKALVAEAKAKGATVGFVPTMGFLHTGHLSLVRESRKRADVTVVSIFVNPMQFGPQEDFHRYPRDPKRDSALLRKEGVDILFVPESGEMYPDGYRTSVEVSGLQDRLCGRSRPGHFRGVATVVLKLFNIVKPDYAFFGEKDAQQVVVLRRMVKDLNMEVEIRTMPIVREPDGLAMSSRNIYLSATERRAALVLSRSLDEVRQWFEKGERAAGPMRERLLKTITAEPLARVDYVDIVDPDSLEPLEEINVEALVALAVYIGKTRLIDNVILKAKRDRK